MNAFGRLTDLGIERFREYLRQVRANPSLQPPFNLLANSTTSEPATLSVPDGHTFRDRLAFAAWLDGAATAAMTPVPRADYRFWAWLSLLLFDHVAPPDERNNRHPGAEARHIPEMGNWRRRYRHLLANPYDIYVLHRECPQRAAVVLASPLHRPGELTEQLASRRDIIADPGVMALATRLYVDAGTGLRKRGASGESARRFGKLMNQFSRTWDLYCIDPDRFAGMLPQREFSRFIR